jgi:hypothetical protein
MEPGGEAARVLRSVAQLSMQVTVERKEMRCRE